MIRIIAVCFLLLPGRADAQARKVITELPRVYFSSHLNVLFPRPPVSGFLDDVDSGYDVELLYRLQHNKPLLAGPYWAESWLSKYVIEYSDIRERANTRRFELGLTAGFYPELNWLLQPYVQGRIGLGMFQSSTIIIYDDEEKSKDRISEQRSTVLAYGLDLGLHIVPNAWYIRGDVRFGIRANPSARFMAYDPSSTAMSQYPIDYFSTYTSSGLWLYGSLGFTILIGE